MPNLREQIASEIAILENRGRQNYFSDYVLSLAAILASFFAGLSVALTWFETGVLAVLSALPAAVLVASDRFNFQAKTKWYFGKAYALKGILSALDFEGLSEADASKRRTAIDAEHEPHWPGLGAPPR